MSNLTFSHVDKYFGDVAALKDFSLEVQPGELITLLGPSGCGKTTALRIAAGFERADRGSLAVSDNEISHLPPQKRNMGMVFQSYSLFPHLTVAENVAFGLSVRKENKKNQSVRVNEMLELVQLGELGARFPHQLSGGQQQRVALARALAIGPSVLLLDEPLSALDAKVRTEVRDEIRALQKRTNTTTLFVTHDQEEAIAISDRVCVMGNGTIHQVGTPRQVYLEPATDFVARFIGQSDVVTLQGHKILVRPEDVTLVPVSNERGRLAYVKRIDFVGANIQLVLMLNELGQEVRSLQHSSSLSIPAVGDAVGVHFSRVLREIE
jgi:putative spermidine/putrescine transport system ATP-binding protein